MFEKEFQCDIDDKFKQFKDPETRLKIHRKTSFCHTYSPTRPSYKHIYKDITFLTCPCTFKDLQVSSLLELENQYNKFGKVPFSKNYIYNNEDSMIYAPAKLIQAFKIIRNFLNELEIEEAKKKEAEIAFKQGK